MTAARILGRMTPGCTVDVTSEVALLVTRQVLPVSVYATWCLNPSLFACQDFLWNVIDLVARESRPCFETASLNFYAESHGKGRCDGAFGAQRRWVSEWCRSHFVSSLEDTRQAIEQGMSETMLLDRPPAGPAYFVKAFTPSKPPTIRKLDVSSSGFQIEYSYCVCVEKTHAQSRRVRGKNLIFSDRVSGDTISLLTCLELAAEKEWRFSYRKDAPEQKDLNLDVLRRRYDRHKAVNPLAGVTRRDPYFAQLLRREELAAKRRAKQQRTTAILAVTLPDAFEEESSGSSSDSSSLSE